MHDILKTPWEFTSEDVKIICGRSCEVIGDFGNSFVVEFYTDLMEAVELEVDKDEFKNLPYEVDMTKHRHFGLIIWSIKESAPVLSVWPVAAYWNLDLKKEG